MKYIEYEDNLKGRLKHFIRVNGLTIKEFEKTCGLCPGYVAAMRKGFGPEKLKNVLSIFPNLNRDWLLYGEGEMFKSSGDDLQSVEQNNIHGNNNNTATSVDNVLLKEIAAHRRQVDELIAIIRDMQKER